MVHFLKIGINIYYHDIDFDKKLLQVPLDNFLGNRNNANET